MQLKVNGKMRTVKRDDELLLWVLRDEVGLTGTHDGCGIGLCGSCTVLVDGAQLPDARGECGVRADRQASAGAAAPGVNRPAQP
ncbi:2Fe-2S iron-sulfur cluster-binding protein [Deinococcus frigens]|uniref:2Fe-2S iron-sulfur cluster-binding protein n=1 Tax=Deinococcus frigens TaxID=249403 RepID=UPI00049568F7|nr:2Fe-2S iron-sulfur cluster-binding protein [Deinococcus frigens]